MMSKSVIAILFLSFSILNTSAFLFGLGKSKSSEPSLQAKHHAKYEGEAHSSGSAGGNSHLHLGFDMESGAIAQLETMFKKSVESVAKLFVALPADVSLEFGSAIDIFVKSALSVFEVVKKSISAGISEFIKQVGGIEGTIKLTVEHGVKLAEDLYEGGHFFLALPVETITTFLKAILEIAGSVKFEVEAGAGGYQHGSGSASGSAHVENSVSVHHGKHGKHEKPVKHHPTTKVATKSDKGATGEATGEGKAKISVGSEAETSGSDDVTHFTTSKEDLVTKSDGDVNGNVSGNVTVSS